MRRRPGSQARGTEARVLLRSGLADPATHSVPLDCMALIFLRGHDHDRAVAELRSNTFAPGFAAQLQLLSTTYGAVG